MTKDLYIVAVSGGVDSVVLLDMLARHALQTVVPDSQFPTRNSQLVVAHFDHGMRHDSASDAAFVEALAQKYGLPFEGGRADLGNGTSEARAREVRYNFLRQCCKKYRASGIITAHHQDDLIETIIINLIRGTGWRGLAPMTQLLTSNLQLPSNNQTSNIEHKILRPLLSIKKAEIRLYAQQHALEWREDSTNNEVNYLRNYIRLNLLPAMIKSDPDTINKLLAINQKAVELKQEITKEIQWLLTDFQPATNNFQLSRYQLVMWPSTVATEVMYTILTGLDTNWHPTHRHIARALYFAKTARINKELQLGRQLRMTSLATTIQFKKV